MQLHRDALILLHRNMVRGRRFDEAMTEILAERQLQGMWCSRLNQEAIDAGAASFLRREDWIWYTHRSITAALARGLDPREWLARTLGRVVGRIDPKQIETTAENHRGNDPVIGNDGSWVSKYRGSEDTLRDGRVIVYLFGNHKAKQNRLHEWMNSAHDKTLPIVWVYANKTSSSIVNGQTASTVESIARFTNGFKTPWAIVSGQDAIVVAEAVNLAVERARRGAGPFLVECKIFDSNGSNEVGTSSAAGIMNDDGAWSRRDPIKLSREFLINYDFAAASELDGIEQDISNEVSEVYAWAARNLIV
jgi:TPP-dependent pyruvate/acetoin dehydrogenase alpha subunit